MALGQLDLEAWHLRCPSRVILDRLTGESQSHEQAVLSELRRRLTVDRHETDATLTRRLREQLLQPGAEAPETRARSQSDLVATRRRALRRAARPSSNGTVEIGLEHLEGRIDRDSSAIDTEGYAAGHETERRQDGEATADLGISEKDVAEAALGSARSSNAEPGSVTATNRACRKSSPRLREKRSQNSSSRTAVSSVDPDLLAAMTSVVLGSTVSSVDPTDSGFVVSRTTRRRRARDCSVW